MMAVAERESMSAERRGDTTDCLTALIDPRGKTTQFDYDPVNQVSQITDALSGVTGFAYDPNGNLLTLGRRKGDRVGSRS